MEASAAPLVTRNDQLTMKATVKGARKEKVAANKKRAKKGKKGGKRNKNNKQRRKSDASSKSLSKSPSKRKLSILKHAKGKAELEDEQEHGGKEKQPRKRARSSGSKPSRKRDQPKEVAPSKQEVKAKAKAKAQAKSTAAKSRARKTADAKEKPKGAGKGRRSKQKIPHEEHPLYCPAIESMLVEFARDCSRFSRDVKSPKFKLFVRNHLSEHSQTALNIYWTRSNCGVTDKNTGADINNFSFNASTACATHRLACAVKCADLAATCLTCAGKFVYILIILFFHEAVPEHCIVKVVFSFHLCLVYFGLMHI